MSCITLNQISCNKRVTINRVEESPFTCRLTELGFRPGNSTTVVRKSPFGSTLYIRLNSSHFALRKKEAEQVIVQDIG